MSFPRVHVLRPIENNRPCRMPFPPTEFWSPPCPPEETAKDRGDDHYLKNTRQEISFQDLNNTRVPISRPSGPLVRFRASDRRRRGPYLYIEKAAVARLRFQPSLLQLPDTGITSPGHSSASPLPRFRGTGRVTEISQGNPLPRYSTSVVSSHEETPCVPSADARDWSGSSFDHPSRVSHNLDACTFTGLAAFGNVLDLVRDRGR